MHLTDMNGNRILACTSIENALAVYTNGLLNNEDFMEMDGEEEFILSMAKGIDSKGREWYAVGEHNKFTNCITVKKKDIVKALRMLADCYWDDEWTGGEEE